MIWILLKIVFALLLFVVLYVSFKIALSYHNLQFYAKQGLSYNFFPFKGGLALYNKNRPGNKDNK